jgi:membrane fusion protein, multidrug efflux system
MTPSRTLALAAALLAACHNGVAEETARTGAAQPITVRTGPVTDTVLARPIVAAGTVAPKDEIPLSFKTGGVIARIAVDPGDPVRAGQTLAVLDLREIDAGVAKARSGTAKTDRDLARARRLYADSVVTLSQLQDAETAAEQANADLAGASFNRRYSVIVAPSDGTVLRRYAEAGEPVDPGAPVLTVGCGARDNVMQVGLADRDAVLVRKGDPATARFDALPGKTFEGRVSEIAASADAGTGTYAVEISLEHAATLAAGLVGQAELHPRGGAAARLVPIESVLEADGDGATVYTLAADGKHAERRRVTVAFIDGARVAVSGGLGGATSVVTDGAAYLQDGSAVTVVR